jgi:hypothetical protein
MVVGRTKIARNVNALFDTDGDEAAHMSGQRHWIKSGSVERTDRASPPVADLTAHEEHQRLKEGEVRLTTGDLGTELRWIVSSPCVASLYAAMQILPEKASPYILRFLAVGWFEEIHVDAPTALRRIEEIIARGDRHFTGRIFFEQHRAETAELPEVLRESLDCGTVPDDYAVVCSLNRTSQNFVVEHVGAKSAIGRLWGTYKASPPCQAAGSYGDTVAETYREVLLRDRPRYDHVLAALRLPDNAVHWVPYHRLIMPQRDSNAGPAVAVISQIAQVDIVVL